MKLAPATVSIKALLVHFKIEEKQVNTNKIIVLFAGVKIKKRASPLSSSMALQAYYECIRSE